MHEAAADPLGEPLAGVIEWGHRWGRVKGGLSWSLRGLNRQKAMASVSLFISCVIPVRCGGVIGEKFFEAISELGFVF